MVIGAIHILHPCLLRYKLVWEIEIQDETNNGLFRPSRSSLLSLSTSSGMPLVPLAIYI